MVRPRKAEATDIRLGAVEAALALLAERGTLEVTMGEVAAATGCRAPALYHHYRNKDALLRAVHDEGFRRLYAEKLGVAARTEGDPLARLAEGGRAYVAFALENPALYRLMFAPPPLEGVAGDPFAHDLGRRSLEFLTASIAACQTAGYFTGLDPRLTAFTYWAAVHGAAMLALQGRAPDGGAARAAATGAVETMMALARATRTPAPSATTTG